MGGEYRSHWGEQGKQGGVPYIDEGGLTLEPHLARFDAGYEDEGRTLLTPARRGRRRGRRRG